MGFFPVNLVYLCICESTERVRKGFSSCYLLCGGTGCNRAFCSNCSDNSRWTGRTNIGLNNILPAPKSFLKFTAWAALPHFARVSPSPLLADSSPQACHSPSTSPPARPWSCLCSLGQATRKDRDQHLAHAARKAAGSLHLPAPWHQRIQGKSWDPDARCIKGSTF